MTRNSLLKIFPIFLNFNAQCKAGVVNTHLKTASYEEGPGTRRIHSLKFGIWSSQIQELVGGYCFPNSIPVCDLLNCNLYIDYLASKLNPAKN